MNTSNVSVFLPITEQGIACPATDPDLLLGVGGSCDSQTRMAWNWGQFSRINDFETFKGTPQVHSVLDLPKDSQNLGELFYQWLWFITAKGYILKSAKDKRAWGSPRETNKQKDSSCHLQWITRTMRNSPKNNLW